MLNKYYDSMLKTHDIFDTFRILDDFYTSPLASKARTLTNTVYRVETKDDRLTLSIDLPGVKSKDLTVQTTGRELKVSGKLRGEDFKYHYTLSKDYNPEAASACLEDGVLTLTFEKVTSTVTRTIEVKVT